MTTPVPESATGPAAASATGPAAAPAAESAPGLAPVVRESTPSLIARTLRRAISDGTFGPGTQLGEAALARSLGVSRGPLREAMQRLTQEGLLVSHRNRGLFVADLTPEAVEDMYLLRTTVETAALDRVLDLGLGADTADALDAAVDAMAALAAEPRSAAMVAADLDFHHALVEAARSPRLSRVHETVLVETSMCLHAMRGTYSDAASRLAEHRAIADAVRAADPGPARALLVDHMRDGLARVLGSGQAV
ncbi:GntR family transcriptional regulator [Dietzia cinnamea]|uniref:GntR family transcriptional regulator n=1 Tax=Dietzia cinnamea TaxID=321318 RepID=A0ABV3YLM2_9ACTN|nr:MULTISPECIES: GntR family transcriptional regulator [Dietzia]AVM64517.1 GntR family transcriptional regulator [Dietzia sp. oral taxon 368]MCT1710811.1 GntR family transcriptional regulator [Dietzia cinnamea]MCT2097056.1 GntR family transcriptional regulator [Dietzia cinnamea]MCT2173028.1 GntR family transcriptional regulator [Dietzia cinnamea]MCT2264460.1 GntR family transcriptional regulator [Dietzia cinnamea]